MDERTAREIEREKPAIRQQYEGTPSWMKAPNGRDTNLTEEQWLAARTKAFKNRYGNWEAAAIKEQLVHGEAVSVSEEGTASIKGQEAEWAKLVNDYGNNKEGAPRSLLSFLRPIIPGTITNKYIGEIGFSNNSIRNSLHHGKGKAKAFVLPYIKEILESSVLIGTRNLSDGKTSYILAKPLLYKSTTAKKTQRFIMMMVVNEDHRGKRYYDHEFTTIKKLDEVSAVASRMADKTDMDNQHQAVAATLTKDLQSVNESEAKKIDALPAVRRASTRSTEKWSEHQSLVSILAEDVWNVNDVSIAVDENGEPIFSDSPNTPDTERKPAPEREKPNTAQAQGRSDHQGGFFDGQFAASKKLTS